MNNISENLPENSNEGNFNQCKVQLLKKFIDCYKSPKMFTKFANRTVFLKIKQHACKSLLKMMNEYFPKLPGLSNLKKFKFISANFIRNINFKQNNIIFNKTLGEFLTMDFGDLNKANFLQNLEIINKIKEHHPEEVFMNKKLKEVFNVYFSSNYFQEELERIKRTEHVYYYERYRELRSL
jgi:hypothetical protein